MNLFTINKDNVHIQLPKELQKWLREQSSMKNIIEDSKQNKLNQLVIESALLQKKKQKKDLNEKFKEVQSLIKDIVGDQFDLQTLLVGAETQEYTDTSGELDIIYRILKENETALFNTEKITHGTILNFINALKNKNFHILHISGHGSKTNFSFKKKQGNRAPTQIDYEEVADWIMSYSKNLQFIFLHNCNSTYFAEKIRDINKIKGTPIIPILGFKADADIEESKVLIKRFYTLLAEHGNVDKVIIEFKKIKATLPGHENIELSEKEAPPNWSKRFLLWVTLKNEKIKKWFKKSGQQTLQHDILEKN